MEIGGISISDLRKEHIPKPFNWYTMEIEEFALTFKGYDYCGSFDACATLSNRSAEDYRTSGS